MKKLFIGILSLFLIINIVRAQSDYQPYSYQFYQKLNADAYSTKSREHTALKPYFVNDSLLKHSYDSLINYGLDNKQHSWGYRKLFYEHLIEIKNPNSTFYADLLPDLSAGRDFQGKLTTGITSLGLQVGGTVSNKLSYYVSGYQSSAVLPQYISNYINQVGIIPGQAFAKIYRTNGYDWQYITGAVSFTPSKYLNIIAGRDKTFIGDGYRSELLSDYSSPYLFLKLIGTLGNVKYMFMITDMNDPANTSQYGISRKKFGVFHYLDWNVSNRFSLGFFDNVIGFFTDDNGQKRSFDLNYINPLTFLTPINNSNGNSDKSLLGFTSKYKLTDEITAYGQFALNEFRAVDFFSSNGSFVNKYGWQLGLRGNSLFGIKSFNYLIETNNAKPYTYSARSGIENYANNSEPLAHPWGANFREVVGLLNYSYKRFDFSGEADYGRYGLDINGKNYGKDVFKVYTSPAKVYGNYTTQGLTTSMVYLEGKVAYLLNPKYNLRIELGGIVRDERNTQFNDKAFIITLGLRSSFRTIYTDIASYKTH